MAENTEKRIILTGGSSPHIRLETTTGTMMRDVLIALVPVSGVAIYNYGWNAAILMFVAMTSAILSEYLWNHFMKKPQTIGDMSALVTGLLLALNVSSLVPWWMMIVGSVFAIVIVKMLFGGIGSNFMNPALAARALLMASWPVQMTSYIVKGVDAASSATPLTVYKQGVAQGVVDAANVLPSQMDMFLNQVGGCLGEASKLAILIGGAYLLYRQVISWHIPLIFTLTAATLSTLFSAEGFMQGDFLFQVLSGGLLLGAFFMANDYATSPMSIKGEVIYAIGCGFLSFIIRRFGGYPEGVSYAILIMNLVVPLIDRFTAPKIFGGVKLHEKTA